MAPPKQLIPGSGLQVSLKRERLELSPVYATAVAHGGHKLGYIRLVNFGAHAAADMEKAMDRLEAQGVEGYILGACAGPCSPALVLAQVRPCRRRCMQSHFHLSPMTLWQANAATALHPSLGKAWRHLCENFRET